MFTTADFARLAGGGGRVARSWRPPSRLSAYAVISTLSFVCYIAARFLPDDVSAGFAAVGVGACGWAWLLARSLFDPAPRDAWWPRVVAGIVALSGALAVLAPEGLVGRVAENLYAISGSAALLLTFVEPFHRYDRDMPAVEKRFRLAFLGLYSLLVSASVLGLFAGGDTGGDTGGAAVRDDLIKSACALSGLVAVLAAVRFRLRRPLAAGPVATVRRAPTLEDRALADRVTRLLIDQELDRDPDLRIGDLADRLGEPEYRVSQCISAALGFANFNRLINHRRIERAKQGLADPQDGRSILQIAFDCGFASIGPFNRAFKDEVSLTPRAYRSAMKAIHSVR